MTEPQTIYAPDVASRMVVVGIERRPDGVLVVHTPTPAGAPAQMVEAAGPQELWQTLQGVLSDPTLPRVTMEAPQSVSLEEALGAMAGDLLGAFVRDKVPAAAPHIQRAAEVVTQRASRKAHNLADRLGKADIPIPRYPRGT